MSFLQKVYFLQKIAFHTYSILFYYNIVANSRKFNVFKFFPVLFRLFLYLQKVHFLQIQDRYNHVAAV